VASQHFYQPFLTIKPFLDKGVLKSYIQRSEREMCVKVYNESGFFTDLNALVKLEKTKRNVIAIKNSCIFIANFQDLKLLCSKSEKHKFFFELIFKDDYMFNSKLLDSCIKI